VTPAGQGGGPLDGVRVVDLTSYIAGSYAAMMLADLGAGVVKVEALEGDAFRELPGFYGWNRGKRSIAVNLKTPEGRAVVHRMAERADVAMENMRPGIADRLGVGYETLRALNPRLVYASVTAFGASGPYRDRPGFDPLLQAMAGVMTLQGFGGPPQYLRIETSLLQGVLALQSGNVLDYPGRQVVYRETPTYRLYRAGDGEWLFLACGNQSFWQKLCVAIGQPELADDPRFASWLSRRDHGDLLTPILEQAFASRPGQEWLRILAEHDIPAARTQPLQAFMQDPAVRHHGMVVDYEHPELGRLTLMGQPLRFSATQAPDGPRPPLLGEHTDAVLGELGYTAAEIADLRARGVVSGAPRVVADAAGEG
jgi:crotonobetainyl-CoA:carnitine CoA-transferase CaiB-like acyl-CoA transferase